MQMPRRVARGPGDFGKPLIGAGVREKCPIPGARNRHGGAGRSVTDGADSAGIDAVPRQHFDQPRTVFAHRDDDTGGDSQLGKADRRDGRASAGFASKLPDQRLFAGLGPAVQVAHHKVDVQLAGGDYVQGHSFALFALHKYAAMPTASMAKAAPTYTAPLVTMISVQPANAMTLGSG